jgi:hypothetical protein
MIDYDREYERLKRDFSEWCSFDRMNIGDKAMGAVNKKQWVVARLFDYKRDRDRLGKQRTALIRQKLVELEQSSPVNFVANKSLVENISKSEDLEPLNQQIKDCEFLIAYLESVVKMITYIAQDIKNIIEAINLEDR